MAQRRGDALFQRHLLGVLLQQIAQVHPAVAKQTEVQLAHGGDAQAVAAGAEILLVGHDEADFARVVRVAKHLCRAVAAAAKLAYPAAAQQFIAQYNP